MSREDVLEEKLTQTLWEEERIEDFSLRYIFSPKMAKHQYWTSPIPCEEDWPQAYLIAIEMLAVPPGHANQGRKSKDCPRWPYLTVNSFIHLCRVLASTAVPTAAHFPCFITHRTSESLLLHEGGPLTSCKLPEDRDHIYSCHYTQHRAKLIISAQ